MHILREWLAPLVSYKLFIVAHQRLEIVGGQFGVEVEALVFLGDLQRLLERAMIEFEDDIGIHLDEPAITVPRKPGIARRDCKPFDRRIVEAEIEDGIHHPRHRHPRARTHRDEQRIGRIAKCLARDMLDMGDALGDLRRQFGRECLALVIIAGAHRRGDSEAGRHRQANRGHAIEVGTLAAEQILVEAPAIGNTAAKAVNIVDHAGLSLDLRKVRHPVYRIAEPRQQPQPERPRFRVWIIDHHALEEGIDGRAECGECRHCAFEILGLDCGGGPGFGGIKGVEESGFHPLSP